MSSRYQEAVRSGKYLLSLNDTLLEEMRRELAFKRLAIDEDGEGLGEETATVTSSAVSALLPFAEPDT